MAHVGDRLILLHGFTQTGRSWQPVVDRLELGPGYDVIAPDLPGHGMNGDKHLSLGGAARILAATYGLSSWVGYSLGGRHALHVAMLRPDAVRSLVLIGATAGIRDPQERATRRTDDHKLASWIEQQGVEPFLDWWLQRPLFAHLTPEQADRDDRMRNAESGLAASLRLAGTGAQESLWDQLPLLSERRIPVLVLAGEHDPKFRAIGERMAEAIGRFARFEVVPGAGHSVPREQPEWVAGRLSHWLRNLPPVPDHTASGPTAAGRDGRGGDGGDRGDDGGRRPSLPVWPPAE